MSGPGLAPTCRPVGCGTRTPAIAWIEARRSIWCSRPWAMPPWPPQTAPCTQDRPTAQRDILACERWRCLATAEDLRNHRRGGCNLALALVQRWLGHRKPVRRLEVRYPVQTSDRVIADARSHPEAPLPAPVPPTYNEGAADRRRLNGQPRGPALARSHLVQPLERG